MSELKTSPAISRLEELLDEHSFVELGAMVTARATDFNLSENKAESDGVVIGHGLIDGNLVFVYSQDSSVLGGTIGEMHAKKIMSVYDMAIKMGAPVIGLVDCGGVRLQESMDALESVGAIYAKATEASGVVPQIVAVLGNCGGGLSVLPGLSDFTFMSKEAKLFVNTPDTIEGNRTEVLDTSSADFQLNEAGNVDFVGQESEVFDAIRKLVCILPGSNVEEGCVEECLDDLNRASEGLEDKVLDAAAFATELSDGRVMFESKPGFAQEMFTGFIKLNGITVGVVGNSNVNDENTNVLTADGCDKAADFINFCDAFDIPLLTLTNVDGYDASVYGEYHLIKSLAKMTSALAEATVPKINFITKDALGSAYVAMNSKSLGADLVFAFADTKIAAMEADSAAKIIYADSDVDFAEKAAEYEATNCGVNNAARRGYVDRIVNPADCRKYLIASFEMLFTKRVEGPYKKHGSK